MRDDLAELVDGIRRRQPRALGRGISRLESGGAVARELLGALGTDRGAAKVVGVTGPPGSGKSTLVGRLAEHRRAAGDRVAVLAVDPSSPFTGGAVLGDRVRMGDLFTDREVFIRSMATRGALGGLARATHDAVELLDIAGFDWILVETVGVGQDEVEVVRSVDTVIVVTVPGLGDEIQAIKAGVLEIADLFVINKADRPGADGVRRDLESMLAMAPEASWQPPILEAVAREGSGVDEILDGVERHRDWLRDSGEADRRRQGRRRRRAAAILHERLDRVLVEQWRDDEAPETERDERAGNAYRLADELARASGLGRLASEGNES